MDLIDWLQPVALIAVGGAIGGIARYWVSAVAAQRWGDAFPWGTLVVNVSGAAAIGVAGGILIAAETGLATDTHAWAFLATGILGSYTTVSSFALQTLAFARAREWPRAALIVGGTVGLCLGAVSLTYLLTAQAMGTLR